jgi:hypothetical protein
VNLPPLSSTSPPANTVEEEDVPELEKHHRTQVVVGVEVEEALGGRPSTGAAPRPLQLPDPGSPSTTTVAEGKSSQIRPATIHEPHSHLRNLEQKEGQQNRRETTHQALSPEHCSPTSPLTPEKLVTGATKRPGALIPQHCRRHRLADAPDTQTAREQHPSG